jgi:lysophospholipase L1-like esterase
MKLFSLILFIFLGISLLTSHSEVNANPILFQAESVRIVVLGSSTALGIGPYNPNNAWVRRYRNYLQGINPANEVINRASGGYTTYHIMPSGYLPPPNRPAPDSNRNISNALSWNPDAIIINLPSNDAAFGYSVSEQLANYDSVLAVADAANVPVWISTTQPRNLSASGRQNLMDMRDSTFTHFGDKSIDFWTDLAMPNGTINPIYDSGDGVHLNDAGHGILFNRVVAAGILDSLLSDLKIPESIPHQIQLYSNYPNPFNAQTIIQFSLPISSSIIIKVHNIVGKEVQTLIQSHLPAGEHRIPFEATHLASGLYFYSIVSNYQSTTGKMILLK